MSIIAYICIADLFDFINRLDVPGFTLLQSYTLAGGLLLVAILLVIPKEIVKKNCPGYPVRTDGV